MDLKGQNIVIFSLFRFDAEIESTSFALARQLARDNEVFYFDNPYTIIDLIRRRKTAAFRKRWGKFGLFSDEPIIMPDSLLRVFILPVLLSIHFLPEGRLYRFLLRVNESLIRWKIRYVLKKRGITDFIFINSFNFHYPNVAQGLQARLKVYQCLDPIIGDFDGRHGLVSERELVENADLIICSSKQLYQEKKALNPHTHFVPNAADIDHSRKALNPDLPLSPLLAGITPPVVGYLGSVDHRMDLPLLGYLAAQHPDKNFVLIGPVFSDLPDSIQQAPNIHFPGKIQYADLPSVLKGFSVCIIPFLKDEQSATVFPLKLFEYLGAGKPVIISDFNPDLQDFTFNSVAICADPPAFSEAIRVALATDSEARRAERIRIASRNTWHHRADALATLLADALVRKGH
ncbi:glycosyltransferase [Salmonirosea aquatica]|uniref:Glycosyltransferase n=1 Tax=Salmonirosea aquatica TaxID=2654236 RepID=A0A7C9FB22_9BACT|nr:glycosyltransferase [Cytophagaceae bacterium SJW1-29]